MVSMRVSLDQLPHWVLHTFSLVLRLLNRYSYTKGNVRKMIKFDMVDLFSYMYTFARKYRSVGAHACIYTTVDALHSTLVL